MLVPEASWSYSALPFDDPCCFLTILPQSSSAASYANCELWRLIFKLASSHSISMHFLLSVSYDQGALWILWSLLFPLVLCKQLPARRHLKQHMLYPAQIWNQVHRIFHRQPESTTLSLAKESCHVGFPTGLSKWFFIHSRLGDFWSDLKLGDLDTFESQDPVLVHANVTLRNTRRH